MRHTLIAAAILTIALPGMASDEDAMTSLSYIAYLERYATLQPAGQQDSLEAVHNMPVVPGDRIDTARMARVEIRLPDSTIVWLDQYTSVSFDAIALSRDTQGDRTVLFLAEGAILVEIPGFAAEVEPMRIDGASTTFYLTTAGTYRIEAQRSGALRLEVWEGMAEATNATGGVVVRTGSAVEAGAGSVGPVEAALTRGDDFARWVEERRRITAGESLQYVDARFGREAAQLDNYGSWVFNDETGDYVWRPDVDPSWRPYTSGRWYWTSTGWTWISYEPWGWLPHHYGSWSFTTSLGWTWSWGPYWGPAWVNWMWWPGYVGWCPAGFYSSWYWDHYSWGHPGRYRYPPGGGGGGAPHPPRGDVVPPRQVTSRLPAPDTRSPADPTRFALDLRGEVPLDRVDPRGWNVVATRDFDSPNLTRVVEPGERALRGRAGERAVVVTGPLVTDAPVRAAPGSAVERVFLRERPTATRDLSPILAREPGLGADEAARLVRPTTTREIARRSPVVRQPEPTAARRTTGNPPTLRSQPVPNIHRSTLPTDARRSPEPGSTPRTGVTRSPSATAPRARSTWRDAPGGRVAPGSAARPAPSGARRPAMGIGPPTAPRSTGGSRPVVVPRSSGGSSSPPPAVRRPSSTRSTTSPGSSSRPATRSTPRSTGGGSSRPAPAPKSASSSRPTRK